MLPGGLPVALHYILAIGQRFVVWKIIVRFGARNRLPQEESGNQWLVRHIA